ncbi:cupin domain-containing protein [Duganella callida]|uniref:AraC family transcriptional regulator n=1 Tax=Duganella callida TaxID=2561932 RepID=A0A4Y9S9U1_9BURK|nr:AraC family transcriptional regulator [Duganella callida]TFW18660.1 AraC family transcriptional regulator [Duganella callida]
MSTIDWLTRLLELSPVSGYLQVRCLYGAPWRVVYEDSGPGEIPYHIVMEGRAAVDDPAGGPPEILYAGDVILLPHGSAHRLHDGSGKKPAAVRNREASNLTVSENVGSGARLDMLCGCFILPQHADRLMRAYLPELLIVRGGDSAGQLAGLVALIRHESDSGNLGGQAMLKALSSALFALVMRLASEAQNAPVGLMALAASPRLAPALEAMMREPSGDWTLPRLAQLCNMSRATMARQFQEKLGRSANSFLTDIRMSLATSELRRPGGTTERVAELVGYQSTAAFKRVFKAQTGYTPAAWRRSSISE